MEHPEEKLASCRCLTNICYHEDDEDTNTADRIKRQRNKEPTASQKQGEFSQCHKDRCVLSSPSLRSMPGSQERRKICMALTDEHTPELWILLMLETGLSSAHLPESHKAHRINCYEPLVPQQAPNQNSPSSWPQKEKDSYFKIWKIGASW